ncbi:hypothetical protein FB451DRAFT_1344717 [Mycena latifolia]|nr:hypothetical protein FB451DRAFT_1344717 [Mycena latifolia]
MPLRGCSFCPKIFSNTSRLLNHLNQPNGRCHQALHIHKLTRKARLRAAPRNFVNSHPEDEAMSEDEYMVVEVNGESMDLDKPTPVNSDSEVDLSGDELSGSGREEFPGAAKTWGGGTTFMDDFHKDEHADKRAENLYYPFASFEEWEMASWLIRANIPVATTNEFLKLKMVKGMSLSFATSKDLRSRVEILPKGPQWKAKPWKTLFPTKRPLSLFYRDPVELLESLLQNPLVQSHIHYTPFRLYKTAAKTMRVYTEWLSGNTAWNMQEKIPEGATIIGTVTSSDKTQISSMTGNRVAYPLLLSTANINLDFRMKASHHAFLLCALLPVAKFKMNNKEYRGVLERRLYHACLDFVFHPLKKAAEVGVMMNDAFGKQRFCFTPLASHTVDTPESLLIAGVAANSSSVTLATYKQFGDSFQHPPRTSDHTLTLIEGMEEDARPWDLRRYCKAAKALGLNGVHRPYWRDWPMSEPHVFLTPEVLHHWFKMFWDHEMQWCITALSDAEIDFRFSVLRPHMGMRHFRDGVSKAKQVTGREHRDIQRYLVAIIAGAEGISRGMLIAIRALHDFRYHGQAPEIDEAVLNKMDQALKLFHEHKHAILKAGVRKGKKGPIDNWCIPKLEFLQSVVPSIRANGVPIQWSADVTEHAHIPLVKEPASHSNNQKYEPQICCHLDRRDKVSRFDLATSMQRARIELDDGISNEEEGSFYEEDEDRPTLVSTTSELLENIEPVARLGASRKLSNYFTCSAQLLRGDFPNAPRPFRTFVSTQRNVSFHLTRDPVGPQLSIHDASKTYQLPDLEPALLAYLQRGSSRKDFKLGGQRPGLSNATLGFQKVQTWHRVRLQSKAFHNPAQILIPETINALPPTATWALGRADAVIINTDADFTWPQSGLQGHTVGCLRMILRLVPAPGCDSPPGTPDFLAYVQRFDIIPPAGGRGPSPDPDTGMYRLKKARRANDTVVGDIIPLDRLRAHVELTPRFGKVADRRLTKENSMDRWEEFWLSKYFTKELFFALSQ